MYDIIKEWHDDFKWDIHVIIMITCSIIIIIVNFSFDDCRSGVYDVIIISSIPPNYRNGFQVLNYYH